MWNGLFVAAFICSFALPQEVQAENLQIPGGEPVLTVSGEIGVINVGDEAVFDLAMLQELSSTEITTTTIWTDGLQVFEGVLLHDLLGALDVEMGTIRATAINDYAVEIPFEDAVEGGPIVAYLRNGAPMMVRDKGPLWIIYPYDSKPEYNSEEIYSRSIWQLDRIEIVH
ncbi:oxidoreductase [Cochlodiniinecator piscidefendens]|uniref:oxidoreductase n=1 Tax=Cochlodiniinecator piscidefendens TaxID=2715756 RepID=UPI00140D0686|nr:oxidoreductase [Cochlodiniinecator piscidefendens]